MTIDMLRTVDVFTLSVAELEEAADLLEDEMSKCADHTSDTFNRLEDLSSDVYAAMTSHHEPRQMR